jgi:hypothetical protein
MSTGTTGPPLDGPVADTWTMPTPARSTSVGRGAGALTATEPAAGLAPTCGTGAVPLTMTPANPAAN